ncbi:MAG: hypothetical protein QF786_10060, partial [Vicinamibacterales bacterium]|nr:hypothetical protein [Vicinamibacterales bacterium]
MNAQEHSLGISRELMPHASCFCELQVKSGQVVRGSLDDLPDFYHTEVCSRDRARSNQIGYSYAWSDLEDLPCAQRLRTREGAAFQPYMRVRAVQRTIPMGDRNATDFSQAAHLGVLRIGGACRPEEYVTYRGPVPRGDTWEGTMIDDHFVVQVMPRQAPRSVVRAPPRDEVLLEAVEQAYDRAGLHPKLAKRVRYANVFEAIGGCIDGLAGKVSAKPTFLLLTSLIAAVVGIVDYCSGLMMHTLLSMFVHDFLFARELLSLFGHAYRFATAAGVSSTTPKALPGAARDEILVAALVLPFAHTDIRAPVHTTLYASDARGGSDPRLGVVSTPISAAVASELWRHRNRRAGYVSLRDPGSASPVDLVASVLGEDDDDDASGVGPPATSKRVEALSAIHAQRRWVDQLADGLGWSCVRRFRATPPNERIHLGELRAVRDVVRLAVRRRGLRDVRLLDLCDSTVVVGAVAKGRSSSTEVNWLLRSFV